MEKFNYLRKNGILRAPKTTGIYAFLGKEKLLYIGKASNLRERIRNHFQQPSLRDGLFLSQVKKVGYIETDSEVDALILEAKLIKKFQPKYNIMWKDDKNYFYVEITKEDYPRIFLAHQIKNAKCKNKNDNAKFKINYLGPFVDGRALKQTLGVLRRIFPYYSVKKHPKGPCPWCHLGLCPGPSPDKNKYQKNIKNLISVLKGKRKLVLTGLKREMEEASLSQDYERALKIRDQIAALEKIIFHAKVFSKEDKQENIGKKLNKILKTKKAISRIEAYDVSNIQGKLATGSMVTFINGWPDKNFYRKFKIKFTNKPNDTAMLREVLQRRLKHVEWPYPDLILIDGGKPQLNVAVNSKFQILHPHTKFWCGGKNSKNIKVVALAKKKNELFIEGQKEPLLLKNLPREVFNLLLQLRDEAHRFAIAYHKKLRVKGLLK